MTDGLDFGIRIGADLGNTLSQILNLEGALNTVSGATRELIIGNETYIAVLKETENQWLSFADVFRGNFFIELGYQLDEQIPKLDKFQRQASGVLGIVDKFSDSLGKNLGQVGDELLDLASNSDGLKKIAENLDIADNSVVKVGLGLAEATEQGKKIVDTLGSKATSAIADTTKVAESLGNAIEQIGSGNPLKGIVNLVTEVKDSFQAFSTVGEGALETFDTLTSEANNASKATKILGLGGELDLEKLKNQATGIADEFQKLTANINNAGTGLDGLGASKAGDIATGKVAQAVDSSFGAVGVDTKTIASDLQDLGDSFANTAQKVASEAAKFDGSAESIRNLQNAAEELVTGMDNASATSLNGLADAVDNIAESNKGWLSDLKITPGLLSDAALSILEITGYFDALKSGIESTRETLLNFAGVSIPSLSNFKESASLAFIEFDTARGKVGTLTDDAGQLADRMKVLAAEFGNQFTATELLNQSYEVLSAGFSKTTDATRVMEASVIVSKAGFTDLQTSVKAVAGVLNAYKMGTEEAKNVADQLIQTQNLGNLTVNEYASGLGQVVSIASQAGVGFTELNSVIAASTLQSIPAAQAVTGLRQAIAAMLKPSSDAAIEAQRLGIEFDATALQSKGFIGVLKELNEKGADTPEIILKLFGSVEAASVVSAVAGKNIGNLSAAFESLSNSAGVGQKAMESVTSTTANQTEAFKNRVTDSLLGIGEIMNGMVLKTVEFGNAFVSAFEKINPTVQLGLLTTASEGVFGVLGKVASAALGTVVSLAALWAAWQAAALAAQYFGTAATVGIASYELLNSKTEIGKIAIFAHTEAMKLQSFWTATLAGQQASYSIAVDYAAIKTWALEAAQKAVTFSTILLEAATLALAKTTAFGVGWALDGFNAILKYVTAQAAAIGSTGVLTLATNAWAASMALADKVMTYLAAKTGGIFAEGLKYSIAQIKIFTVQILTLAAQVALAILAFDAIGNTFQIFKTAIAGDELKKSLEGVEGSTKNIKQNIDGIQIAPLNETGQYLVAVFQDMGDRLNYFVSNLGAGQDRAKGFIDNIATGLVNATNLLTGGKSAADKYGESWRFITQAQYEAQQQTINVGDAVAKAMTVLDDGNALIGKYGLTVLEAADRSRLGKDGIKAFSDEAAKQVEALNRNIETLKKVKTSDVELQASIQTTIALYEKQKNSILGRINFLNSEAKATTETAISIEGLNKSYESEIKTLEATTNQKKVLVQEQQAAGLISAVEASTKLLKIDSDSYTQRLAIAKNFQAQIKALLTGASVEDQKKLNDSAAKIDADGWKAREDIAKAGIANRDKVEKEAKDTQAKLEKDALDGFEAANKKAELSLRMSQSDRTQAVKEGLLNRTLTEQQASIQFAQIAQDGANQEVQIIQDKINRINALEISSKEGAKKKNEDLLKLQEDLANANIRAIDSEITTQKAIQDVRVAAIESTGQKEIQALELKRNAQDALLVSQRAELDLLNAKTGLQEAQAALDEGRLEAQIKLETSEGRKAQLEVDLSKLKTANQQKQFDAQESSLRLTQLQTQAELERELVIARIAKIEADVALSKARSIKGTSQLEIDGLAAIVDLRAQQITQSEQAISRQQEINSLQTDELKLKRVKATEDNLAEIKANGLTDATSRLNKNLENSVRNVSDLGSQFDKTGKSVDGLADKAKDMFKAFEFKPRDLSYVFNNPDAGQNINEIIKATEKLMSLNNANPFGGGGFDFGKVTGKAIQEQRAALEKAYGLTKGASTLAGSFKKIGNIKATELGGVGLSQSPSTRVSGSINNSSTNQNTINIIDSSNPYSDLTNALVAVGRA